MGALGCPAFEKNSLASTGQFGSRLSLLRDGGAPPEFTARGFPGAKEKEREREEREREERKSEREDGTVAEASR